jgi:hypothetical protein
MVYYALGSILFAGALMAAFTVMTREFRSYHGAMMKALRSLSLDGLSGQPAKPTISLTSSASRLSPLPRAA